MALVLAEEGERRVFEFVASCKEERDAWCQSLQMLVDKAQELSSLHGGWVKRL